MERLDRSLECGTLVIGALQDDLSAYIIGPEESDVIQNSKAVWNERSLQDHQHRIRGQVLAMSLLLQVIELPSSERQHQLLQTSQHLLRNSDESAHSIVPSLMSVSTRARDSIYSTKSNECTELIYRQLSFEKDLFAAGVYKRKYKDFLMRSVFRSHKSTSPLASVHISNTTEPAFSEASTTFLASGDAPRLIGLTIRTRNHHW